MRAQDDAAASASSDKPGWPWIKITCLTLLTGMVVGVVLDFYDDPGGLGSILFFLSLAVAAWLFVDHSFRYAVLGVHGPGWYHPGDYFLKSWQLRAFLVGVACWILLWWRHP